METIEGQIKNLAEEAKRRFLEENLLSPEVAKRETHSSIFNIKGDEELFQHLYKNKIICSQRGDGIRISFNYFNTLEDLEHLMKALRSWKEKNH